ncbi:Thrombospondin-1 [Mactra antiquata]
MLNIYGLKSTYLNIVFIIIVFIKSSYSQDSKLDCFNCSNITNIEDCHVIKTCSPSQACYTESYTVNGQEMFTLGCKEAVFCLGIDKTHLIGRRETGTGCSQCCSLHGCNKYLCPVRFTASPPQVDGKWSDWGGWGECSSSCGIGLQFRYRLCDNPPPSANGRLCLGDAKDVGLCNKDCSYTGPSTTDPPKVTSTTTHYNDVMTSQSYVTNDETQTPGECKDLIDCSGYYRPEACHGIYSPWAHRFCPVHCGFCPTVSTDSCTDAIENCHEYQSDVCTKQDFWQWRESHCRKYCNLC